MKRNAFYGAYNCFEYDHIDSFTIGVIAHHFTCIIHSRHDEINANDCVIIVIRL